MVDQSNFKQAAYNVATGAQLRIFGDVARFSRRLTELAPQ